MKNIIEYGKILLVALIMLGVGAGVGLALDRATPTELAQARYNRALQQFNTARASICLAEKSLADAKVQVDSFEKKLPVEEIERLMDKRDNLDCIFTKLD